MGCMRSKADPRRLVGRWVAFGVCSSGTNRRLQASCCDGVVWRRMLHMAMCRVYVGIDPYQGISTAATRHVVLGQVYIYTVINALESNVSHTCNCIFQLARVPTEAGIR